jgi:hypothetical protein
MSNMKLQDLIVKTIKTKRTRRGIAWTTFFTNGVTCENMGNGGACYWNFPDPSDYPRLENETQLILNTKWEALDKLATCAEKGESLYEVIDRTKREYNL